MVVPGNAAIRGTAVALAGLIRWMVSSFFGSGGALGCCSG